jgi:branched-subunit amino acid ABC-type transport system permease component
MRVGVLLRSALVNTGCMTVGSGVVALAAVLAATVLAVTFLEVTELVVEFFAGADLAGVGTVLGATFAALELLGSASFCAQTGGKTWVSRPVSKPAESKVRKGVARVMWFKPS